METESKVTLRLKDLESHARVTTKDGDEDGNILNELDAMDLHASQEPLPMELGALMGDQSKGVETPAVDCKSHMVVKESFKKFVDAFHEKASTLTTWMSSLEPPTLPNPNPRQVTLLGLRWS